MKLARRESGHGFIVLIGGGEFSFEETEAADAAWLGKTGDGSIVFLPTASGSVDYAKHFAVYLDEYFERTIEPVPVYRSRDTRRRPNLERLASAAAVYIGGGVADRLLETVSDTPVAASLRACLAAGGVVVGIAAGAQALGRYTRSLTGGRVLDGLGFLDDTIVDTNFDPAHDRRLRRLLAQKGGIGLGITPGSAVLVAPDGTLEVIGTAYRVDDSESPLLRLEASADIHSSSSNTNPAQSNRTEEE